MMINATQFDEAGPLPDDPSPAEIAAACLEIQARWSSGERMKRLRPDWRPSYRRVDGGSETFDQQLYDSHHATHDAFAGCDTR